MIENEELRTVSSMNDHDIRKLQWQNKQLGKALGRAGSKIHELRCQLAESREINHRIARGELRDLERQVARDAQIIGELRINNAKLWRQNAELTQQVIEMRQRNTELGDAIIRSMPVTDARA